MLFGTVNPMDMRAAPRGRVFAPLKMPKPGTAHRSPARDTRMTRKGDRKTRK